MNDTGRFVRSNVFISASLTAVKVKGNLEMLPLRSIFNADQNFKSLPTALLPPSHYQHSGKFQGKEYS